MIVGKIIVKVERIQIMIQNEEKKTVRINKSLHQKIKLHLAEEGIETGKTQNLASFIEKAIKYYLEKKRQ